MLQLQLRRDDGMWREFDVIAPSSGDGGEEYRGRVFIEKNGRGETITVEVTSPFGTKEVTRILVALAGVDFEVTQ